MSTMKMISKISLIWVINFIIPYLSVVLLVFMDSVPDTQISFLQLFIMNSIILQLLSIIGSGKTIGEVLLKINRVTINNDTNSKIRLIFVSILHHFLIFNISNASGIPVMILFVFMAVIVLIPIKMKDIYTTIFDNMFKMKYVSMV